MVGSLGSRLDPVLMQGCPRPAGTRACGVRGQHVCVCMSHPVIHQGVYVCFQVHMEMVVCWEGVRPPVCAKVVSWEMRAGARGQVGDSVQPLGGGLCSQMSMHLYRAGLGPQASPWPQMQTLALLFCRSVVSDSATPWTVACWASLSFAISWSLLRVMSSESMTPSNHLILCRSLLFLPSIFPSIFPTSRLFASGGQSTEASASASVLP